MKWYKLTIRHSDYEFFAPKIMLKEYHDAKLIVKKIRLPDVRGNVKMESNYNGRLEEVGTNKTNFRAALISEIITARSKRGITQKKLEEMSGVKQPVISKIEQGVVTPNLGTILKILAALEKTLYIGDIDNIAEISDIQS